MPNWCECTLIVSGVNAAAFYRENASDEKLSFSKSVPPPENATALWAMSAWGTKRNACSVDAHVEPECVQYTFLTAWVPPDPWIFTVSKLYPLLTFDLKFEEYLNCRGHFKVKNGNVAVDEHTDYFREATREDAAQVIEKLGLLQNLSTTHDVPEMLRLKAKDMFMWSISCVIPPNPGSLHDKVESILKKHALARARDRLESFLRATVVLNRFAKVVVERYHAPGGALYARTRKRFEEMTFNAKRQKKH